MPAAVAIPLALGAGTAVAGLAGAKINANAQNKSAKLSTDAANHAADVSKASNDEALAFQKEQAAADQARWEAAQRANYGQYVNRAKAAQALGDTIGFHLADPAPYMASDSGSGSASGGKPTGGSADALKALLDKGMDPQQAAAAFNKQYGRSTGNEAVYYDPSQHGGVATIGLPDAYLSLEKNGWSITPRSGGGASSGGGGATVLPNSIGSQINVPGLIPQTPPFQLRSINAFLR